MSAADALEVHVELGASTTRVGTLRRHAARRGETVTFEYADQWLAQR